MVKQAAGAELSQPYKLTQEQIEFYREKGFIKLRNVFSPDTLRYYLQYVQEEVNAIPFLDWTVSRAVLDWGNRSSCQHIFINLIFF